MERSWMNDPRLKGMDSRKLKLLTAFADKIAKAQKGQLKDGAGQKKRKNEMRKMRQEK